MVTAVGDEEDGELGTNTDADGCEAATLVLAPEKAGEFTDVITATGLKETGIEGEADEAVADEDSCKKIKIYRTRYIN